MKDERWHKISGIFNCALERPREGRADYLREVCGEDASLRGEVEALLAAHEGVGQLDSPAIELVAPLLAESGVGLAEGAKVGSYRIVEQIGVGGMGEVYLAQDERLGRRVALKLLPARFVKDAERLDRFEREAKAASGLNHPNILTIHEFGEVEGSYFIVTEFIDGDTLRSRMGGEKLPLGDALEIAIQTAAALVAAHAAGIIHRDIKPENIMVRRDGYVKVLDFGLAKLTEQGPRTRAAGGQETTSPLQIKQVNTEQGRIMGTASYMSPEQARGLRIDARTDIFSLGVVLYEMVTGRQPFVGATMLDTLAAVLNTEPELLRHDAPEAPRELEHIVTKALRKDRDERYQSIKDMLIDLRDLKRDLELQAQLERSAPPESRARAVAIDGSNTTIALTAQTRAVETGPEILAHQTSSAEYIVNQVKSHRRVVALTLAVLALAAVAAVFWHFKQSRAPVLTERDTIMLADFVNTTGDEVFDGALKQALAIQLEQSPFLNIFSEQQVRETLRYMGRSPDERVTRDVAREICQRQGIKAMLAGSIASLGSRYVIGLEATNALTGDVIAREQAEAESKEQVLGALGKSATTLRGKLGESLRTIQKFDAPIEQATTSSLEALKAFSLGYEQNSKGNFSDAILLLKRAIELDPNFPRAHSSLAAAYQNARQRQLAVEEARRSFELRERASEREKFLIDARYYQLVTREIEKTIETLELLKRTYPRDLVAPNNLGVRYSEIGQYEKAIEEFRQAININPNTPFPHEGIAIALIKRNRLDEAKEICERLVSQKIETLLTHYLLYTIAFFRGDAAGMQQQVDWAAARANEFAHLGWQGNTALFSGQLRKAQEFYNRAIEIQERRKLKEGAAGDATFKALASALFGYCGQAKDEAVKGLAIAHSDDSVQRAAIALALCGEITQAQSLADEVARQYPKATLINAIDLPIMRAAIEISRNNPAQAIQALQPARAYEASSTSGFLLPEYLRGLAYLKQEAGAEAAAEFQKMLDHRAWSLASTYHPLAQLGLARAAALQGDSAKARAAYQDFFALWKDADPDIPILRAARREYEKLKQSD